MRPGADGSWRHPHKQLREGEAHGSQARERVSEGEAKPEHFDQQCRNIVSRAKRRTPDKAPDAHAKALRTELARALTDSAGRSPQYRALAVVALLGVVDR